MYLFLISVAMTCLLAAATIALYPAVLWVVVPRPRAAPKAPLDSPQVSMLVAVHNGESRGSRIIPTDDRRCLGR